MKEVQDSKNIMEETMQDEKRQKADHAGPCRDTLKTLGFTKDISVIEDF